MTTSETSIQARKLKVQDVAPRVLWEAQEEQGHDIHPWKWMEWGVGLTAACSDCGQLLTVEWDEERRGVVVDGANVNPCTGTRRSRS